MNIYFANLRSYFFIAFNAFYKFLPTYLCFQLNVFLPSDKYNVNLDVNFNGDNFVMKSSYSYPFFNHTVAFRQFTPSYRLLQALSESQLLPQRYFVALTTKSFFASLLWRMIGRLFLYLVLELVT